MTQLPNTFRNDVEVYDAPMTDVIAALQITTPKTIFPVVAERGVERRGGRVVHRRCSRPPVTTPRTARNSTIRITAVITMPSDRGPGDLADVLDAADAVVDEAVRPAYTM